MNGARGEVWLYERPQRKPRPVLILVRSCALVLDETFAARKDFLTHRITELGAEKMDEAAGRWP